MGRIVKPNRRFSSYSRAHNPKAWTLVAEYSGRDIAPLSEIPVWLIDRWTKSRKGFLNHASFNGFTPEEARIVIALVKGCQAVVDINRWGHVAAYRLKP